ncbi:MAG: citrate/2-methylcitrate synthase [Alkalispirochaeta sp.]
MITRDFFTRYSSRADRRNSIDPLLHKRYNTKRGLRNDDGTGVLIGLTEIGEVHGYVIDDQERVPDHGQLWYRGLSVNDLVRGFQNEGRFGFAETAYLLLFGELPTVEEHAAFCEVIGTLRRLPDGFTEDMILQAPSNDIMNKLARSVLAAYSYDENPEELSVHNVTRQLVELIARFPTMVAYGYQALRHYYHGESLYIHSPSERLSTAENLLAMIRPDQTYTPLEAETLDLALVLHAEHGGGNNSAFTIHVVSSAATDTYSAVSAAVGSLKGAKHGGAAARVRAMMTDIKEHVSDWSSDAEVAAYLTKILRKEAFDRSGLIYGVGHAVYTLSDPRALLLQEKARDLAVESAHEEEFDLYQRVAALAPTVFQAVKETDRVIAPNVDFYSGFVYSMLGIPEELYTPIFAIARITGWAAHRLEELVSGGRIIRPAYKNVVRHRAYIPIQDRRSDEE